MKRELKVLIGTDSEVRTTPSFNAAGQVFKFIGD
jgi:hypothetical protein